MGFKVFYYHKTALKRNLQKINEQLNGLVAEYWNKSCDAHEILQVLEGWNGYAKQGNTYNLRKRLASQLMASLTAKPA